MSKPIKREDIRKGDKIRRTKSEEYVAVDNGTAHQTGYTYELIERPVTLPTVPGLYLDKHKDVWRLTAPNNRWFCLADTKYDYRETEYAPFTPLRDPAEVAAEVLAEVANVLGYDVDPFGYVAAKFGATK